MYKMGIIYKDDSLAIQFDWSCQIEFSDKLLRFTLMEYC